MLRVFLLTVYLGLCLGQPRDDEVIIETIYGRVAGHNVFIDHYGFNITSFLGVPFARPQDGELRFQPPQPPEPWEDVFLARRLGDGCWQTSTLHYLTHPGFNRFSEDCLNMNIYTPVDMNPDEPYPVMVYFYGGGFSSGWNIMYNGHYLAARDVVVVVPNYRIGIMGFSTTGDSVNPGNNGLYDQLASLQWVQDNIAAFGGDPNRVTIFGQSAGAASAGHHIMSPLSRGLFHAAIQQSGCESNFWSINWPPQMPWTYTEQVAERFDCPTDDSEAMMDCLRSFPAENVTRNQRVDCTPGSFCLGHVPVIDGEFITANPLDLRESGDFAEVPLFSGFNREDGSLYLFAYVPESIERGFNRSEYLEYTYERLLTFWEAQFTPEQTKKANDAVAYYYSPWPYINDLDLNRQAMVDMVTDGAWTYTTDRMLRSHSTKVDNTYYYVFAYRSTNASYGIWEGTEWSGVPHSAEIPYVWGWPLLQLDPDVRRDSRIFIDIVDWNDEDYAYAEFTMDLFTNFAKTYNPTPEPIQPPGDLPLLTYPPVRPMDAQYVLIDNGDVSAGLDYRVQPAAFMREYMSYIIDTPITRFKNNAEAKKVLTKRPDGEGVNTQYLEDALNSAARAIAENAITYDSGDFEIEDDVELVEF